MTSSPAHFIPEGLQRCEGAASTFDPWQTSSQDRRWEQESPAAPHDWSWTFVLSGGGGKKTLADQAS